MQSDRLKRREFVALLGRRGDCLAAGRPRPAGGDAGDRLPQLRPNMRLPSFCPPSAKDWAKSAMSRGKMSESNTAGPNFNINGSRRWLPI